MDDRTEAPALDELAPAEGAPEAAPPGQGLDGVMGLRLEVQVLLGRTRIPVSRLLDLTPGTLVDLDRGVGEPVDVVVGDQLIARGTLTRTAEDRIGVALTEILRAPAPGA